jgi:hypothetical protein
LLPPRLTIIGPLALLAEIFLSSETGRLKDRQNPNSVLRLS